MKTKTLASNFGTFLFTKDSMDWLFQTHLKMRSDRGSFRSALLEGNEDCPKTVLLFKSQQPLITDQAVVAIENFELAELGDVVDPYDRIWVRSKA